MAFTAVKTSLVAAFPGMRTSLDKNKVASCVSEEASAEIRWGIAVKRGTGDDGALVCTATTDKLRGIVQYTAAAQKDNELGDTGIKPKNMLDVATQGELYVLIDENVTPASAVRVRVTAAGGVSGSFRASAVAGQTIDISKFARWKETRLAAEGFCLLEFDFTMSANGAAD